MTMVTEYDWETNTWTHTGDTAARQAWRDAVAEIAAKAKATLPACNGRVDRAVQIVLNHDVELLEDGKARVCSQSHGQVVYHVVNGECSCKDYPKAPSGWCKHRIAAGLYKRATALVQHKLTGASNGQAEPLSPPTPAHAEPEAPTAPLPEAPVSITLKAALHGHEVLVTLRGVDFASVKAQVEEASTWLQTQRGPTTDATPQCPTHGTMKPSTKGKGWYCPHKLADGSWCKGT